MTRRRVVVTGMGIVSPVGIGLAPAWEAILAARSGVGPITRFDASTFPSRIAAEVKDFDVGKYLSAKEARRYDTFIHYGLVAAMEAVRAKIIIVLVLLFANGLLFIPIVLVGGVQGLAALIARRKTIPYTVAITLGTAAWLWLGVVR